MRVDRVKLIAEMARQNIHIPTLLTSQRLCVGVRIFSTAQLYIKARMVGFS